MTAKKPIVRKHDLHGAGRRHPQPRGFSLIVTLVLMLLLTVLAVGLLSLSSISLRGAVQGQNLATARANARLSLMMAIGQLQLEMGPDCRISAAASIMDRKAETPEADSVAHPRYLGVWDSWDTWLTDPKKLAGGGTLKLQDSYAPGRNEGLFRDWLVSHPDPQATRQRAMPENSGGALPTVQVVGKGSVGSASEGLVSVPVVPFSNDRPGAIAWWTTDESQKARMDLEERSSDPDWQVAQVNSSAAGRTGIEALKGVSQLETTPEVIGKLLDEPTLMVALGQNPDPDQPRHFHNLGGHSLGLLTDVRSGGLKKDLNLLFESDELPAEIKGTHLFGSRSFDAPIRPMTGELARSRPQNPYVAPVSWRQIREYYRLYRGFQSSDPSGRALVWNGGKPSTRRYLAGRKTYAHILTLPDTMGYARQPVLLRQTWVIATRAEPVRGGSYDYYLVGVPVFHLWNPYNVPMTIGSQEMAVVGGIDLAATLRYKLYRDTQMVADRPFTLTTEAGGGGYAAYQVRPTEAGNADIVFQPGEVRVFTIDSQVTGPSGAVVKEFDAVPGYRPFADTSAVRGLQVKLTALAGAATGRPSLALRFDDDKGRQTDNYWWGNSPSAITVGMYQMNSGKFGVVDESGKLVVGSGGHNATVYGAYSVDWMLPAEKQTWIVPDTLAARAEWNTASTRPTPIAIISITAKGAENFEFDGSGSFAGDFRNRTWLHAPPTRLSEYLQNPGPLARANSAYQVYFRPVNGDQEVSQYIQVAGKDGFYGGGFSPGSGQTHVPVCELPTAPVTSLAAFAGMRVDHARALVTQGDDSSSPQPGGSPYPMYTLKHIAASGGGFGAGISNSYANPMIKGDSVYTRNALGVDMGHPSGNFQGTSLSAFDDYWDHLFLANEGLWDSWFMSSLTPETNRGQLGRSTRLVADAFFKNTSSLPHLNLKPYLGGASASAVSSEIGGDGGWRKLSSHLLVKGAFNVNSTSVEAWTAMLMGLKHRQVATLDAKSLQTGVVDGGDRVLLSRFRLANGSGEGADPSDEMAWRGVRFLSDKQITDLAGQIVRQVKLRGPFLNMSEFVNRRLSTDDLGVTGALQAAIDSDEFDAGYDGNGSSSSTSINGGFKSGDSMITALPANYPNQKAARGSRFAGAPGYVMQSDLLQGLGSSLTVRGDTFTVRGYGDARDTTGKIIARAWCEAVVQRMPEYVDSANPPQTAARLPDGTVNGSLSALNQRFGRKLQLTSFRWLSADEI